MKLYFIELIDAPLAWEGRNHILTGFIIAAGNIQAARKIADSYESTDDKHPYLQSKRARCIQLSLNDTAGMILAFEGNFGTFDENDFT